MELELLLIGFAGGIIRGLVGYVKYHFNYKNVTFKWSYFLLMVALSGLIGLSAGWIVEGLLTVPDNVRIFYVFLAGYAGADFLENAYKTIFKKATLFNVPSLKKVN